MDQPKDFKQHSSSTDSTSPYHNNSTSNDTPDTPDTPIAGTSLSTSSINSPKSQTQSQSQEPIQIPDSIDILKPSSSPLINKKKLFIDSSSILGRHPSGRHLSDQVVTDTEPKCFSGVNVILASPNNGVKLPMPQCQPYALSLDRVDDKLYESSDVYFIKNKGRNLQLNPLPNAEIKKEQQHCHMNNKSDKLLSFSIQQKMLDDKLTLSIKNKEGYKKIEETICSFHTLKKTE